MRLFRNPTFRAFLRPQRVSLLLAITALAAEAQSAPKVEEFTFRQFEGGPPWLAGYRPSSSEPVYFDFRIAGFGRVEGDFEDKASIDYEIAAVDSSGRLLAPPIKGKTEPEITEQDKKKDWKPKANGSFTLPAYMAAGAGKVQVKLHDMIAKTESSAEFPFEIAGPAIAPGAALGVRNFRFLRSEKDDQPLAVPAYRPGDTVWARFEIIGFTFSDEKKISVTYGLNVRNELNKVLYQQEVAAEELKELFYPPAYMPGVISLQLQPNTPKGRYNVRLTVRDRLSGNESPSEHEFRIE